MLCLLIFSLSKQLEPTVRVTAIILNGTHVFADLLDLELGHWRLALEIPLMIALGCVISQLRSYVA